MSLGPSKFHPRRAFATVMLAVVSCGRNDPAIRVSSVLQELAPTVRLRQTLADARRAYPTLVIQRDGELHDYFPRSDTTRIFPVAVTVRPATPDTTVAVDSIVDGIEFVTSPSSAAHLARHVAEVFQNGARVSCGSLAANGRDSVLTFDTHGRGGVTITFPVRRTDYDSGRSHVFIYAGRWSPESVIPNYLPARCGTTAAVRKLSATRGGD